MKPVIRDQSIGGPFIHYSTFHPSNPYRYSYSDFGDPFYGCWLWKPLQDSVLTDFTEYKNFEPTGSIGCKLLLKKNDYRYNGAVLQTLNFNKGWKEGRYEFQATFPKEAVMASFSLVDREKNVHFLIMSLGPSILIICEGKEYVIENFDSPVRFWIERREKYLVAGINTSVLMVLKGDHDLDKWYPCFKIEGFNDFTNMVDKAEFRIDYFKVFQLDEWKKTRQRCFRSAWETIKRWFSGNTKG